MTAPLYAYDGASAFDVDAAKAHGGIAATTYIRGTPGGMPHADAIRVSWIRSKGLGASPNWEATADYFGTCSLVGATWAGTDALAACRALGYPDDGSIACSFSFDFDVPAGRYPEMGAKVRAITAALGGHYRTMIYGQESLIIYLAAHGFVTGKHWLMMSTFGQAYDPSAAYFCMIQGHDVNGNWINSPVAGTDINTVTDPRALYAWWPTGSPYATPTGGTFMALTDAQELEIYQTCHFLNAAFRLDPLRVTGEFGLALRSLHDNFGHLATDADVAAAAAAIKAVPAVTLTDVQVQAIATAAATAIVAKLPTPASYAGTFTPQP